MCRNSGTERAISRTCPVVKLDRTASRGRVSHAPVSRTAVVVVAYGWITDRSSSSATVASSTSDSPAASSRHGGGGNRHPSPCSATSFAVRSRSCGGSNSDWDTPSGSGPLSTYASCATRSGARSAAAVTTTPP
jgi:hypothetical protein